MGKYDNWVFTRGKSVNSLILDDLNPRMPPESAGKSQSELIEDLINDDDAISLARQIALHGFFPNSDIIVMPKANSPKKWVVLEGNRRVCAIKVLRRPELAPAPQQKRWRMLGADTDELAKINVWVVPDRESAEVYLALKHAPPEKGLFGEWLPMQKAAYYGRFLGDLSISEVAQRFSTSEANVASHLRMYRLYQLGRRLPLAGSAKRFWEPRNFPYSVVERIIDSPEARDFLRLKFEREGDIEIGSSTKSFLNAFQIILENIGSGDDTQLNTRTLDKAGDITPKLAQLIGKKASTNPFGGTLVSQIIEKGSAIEDAPPAEPAPAPKKKLPAKKAPKRYGNQLFPDRLVSQLKDDRLPSILTEMQTIEAKQHNATGVLLRISLELAMIGWLKKKGEWKKVSAGARNQKFGPMLSEMFKHIEKLPQGFADPLDHQEKNALTNLLHKGDLDNLNGWVHNPNYPSDPAAVQSLCIRLRPLLERLLSGK
jgi:hypothetical protein